MIDITLSAAARTHLAKKLADSGRAWLRLSLREAGCSGLEYVWQPVDAPHDDDLRLEGESLSPPICIDHHDYQRALKGLSIGFEQDMLSSALTYHNPNQSGTCGCGVSFTVG